MRTSIVLVTELGPGHLDWGAAQGQAEGLVASLEPRLGLAPRIRLASLPPGHHGRQDSSSDNDLAAVLVGEAETGCDEIFVVPTMLDFGLLQRARLSEAVGAVRLDYHQTLVAYDDVAFDRRPLLQALSERIFRALAGAERSADRSGLLLLASGEGDTSGRAQSYQLMRLVIEQLGCARGEVAFLDHARPLFEEQLERCAGEGIGWTVVPQMLWRSEPFDDARRRFDGFLGAHREARGWTLLAPVGISPAPIDRDPVAFSLAAWLEERIMVLWRSRRRQFEAKRPSPMQGASTRVSCLRGPESSLPIAELCEGADGALWYGDGCIAEIHDLQGLAGLLSRTLGATPTDRVFIKVTWHGYAPGTYTDPVVLDRLLAALPVRAVIVEGHTSSRNLGGATWDWQTEGQQHRAWIAEQDAEYLRRTGLDAVMQKHRAQYLNVTEVFWDGQCAPRARVDALLAEAGIELRFPELADFVPQVFFEYRDAPFISLARFKGPQRASMTNLFGLIPTPLRTVWHGRTVAHFARVCCDLARIYRCLFRTMGMVEALNVAVRWNPSGLYRSRWGNYDLIPNTGIVTLSANMATADVLASRLQGLPVDNNLFFQTVRDEIGFPDAAARLPIPDDLVARLV
jgi:sirohydrochlorin ferrochelatase